MKIRLSGFVEAFEGLTAALEATRNAAAPAYREAVEDWAETTTRKAVENLDRPHWLLSRSMTEVVKPYHGVLWALSGIKHESIDPKDPGYYVIYHEAGWRPNKGKPSAPIHFMTRAKRETTFLLLQKVRESDQRVQKAFHEILKKEIARRKAK